jgi:RNA polymerase sigma-70 factor, ECF subfamily
MAAGFQAVFEGHYARLVSVLAVACGDRDLAADLVQEAFVQLWVNWNKIREYDSPSAWVARVAINRLHNHRRSLQRLASALLRQEREPQPLAPTGEFAVSLAAALRLLPLRQRIATVLYYLDDRPIAEIATTMGISEGTVNRYLNRAREALRTRLED